LSGYDSLSSFARAFQQAVGAKPSEYRRGKKGPARAGGATGAYAKRQRRPSYRPGVNEGLGAIWKQEFAEAEARLADRRALEQFERIDVKFSFIETVEEMRRPRRLRDDPAYWRERRRLFEKWRAEKPADDEHIAARAARAEAVAAMAEELSKLISG
jgi:hypothetical protein